MKALEDPTGEWGDKIMELMAALDKDIPEPKREIDKDFLMPVEDVFSIKVEEQLLQDVLSKEK